MLGGMRCRCLVVVASLLLAGCGGGGDVRLVVPPPTLAGEPAQVRVAGLSPGQHVELRARWRSADGPAWSGGETVSADHARVGMELLSRLAPPRGARSFFELPVGRSRIEVSVADGSDTVARATLVRDVAPPRVHGRELTVARDGVAGAYFAAPRPRGAVVLLLGGSEGGSSSERPVAAQLAAAGHSALVLAYFGAPGLPRKLRRVPVETVARGTAWLRRRPEADRAPRGAARRVAWQRARAAGRLARSVARAHRHRAGAGRLRAPGAARRRGLDARRPRAAHRRCDPGRARPREGAGRGSRG